MKRPRPAAASAALYRRRDGPAREEPPRRGRLSTVVCLALLAFAVLYATVHMNTLSDTWISLAGGRHVLAHGVDDQDPFSFNSRPAADRVLATNASGWQRLQAWALPRGWINQNWLSHVILFAVWRAGGGDALLVWKLVLYAAVAAILVLAGKVRGASLAASATIAAAALAASRAYLEIRAQDHTNLVAAVVTLLLALAARRDRRWLWALPPVFGVWSNLHGGFVFGFAVIVIFLLAGALARRAPAFLRQLPPGVMTTGSVALATAVAASVVLSPYRLANITHPIEISVGTDATLWRTVTEWQPLWRDVDAAAVPFIVLTAAVVLLMAGAVRAVRRTAAGRPQRAAAHRPAPAATPFDLQDAAVVFFALAMAFLSRRFVPLASVIAAPPAAAWLSEALARRRARTAAAAAAAWARPTSVVAGLAVAAAFVWLGVRCERTYAGPWPFDFASASTIDRLSYAHLRPRGVCGFLAANGVAGRIWNFWEEGGYLSWCQPTSAATGRVPVQVFIDGRAQGAYPADALRAYYLLRAGGPAGQEADAQGRLMNPGELERARGWLRRQLAGDGVWLADVPYAQQDLPISLLLLNTESWQAVYADEEHTLLADTDTPDGRALSIGVDSGATRFPDAFSAALTRERRALGGRGGADTRRLLELARAVVAVHPSARAVRLLAAGAAAQPDRTGVAAFCREVVADFLASRARYRGQDGYGKRLQAVEAALEVLSETARAAGDRAGIDLLAGQLADISRDREETLRLALW